MGDVIDAEEVEVETAESLFRELVRLRGHQAEAAARLDEVNREVARVCVRLQPFIPPGGATLVNASPAYQPAAALFRVCRSGYGVSVEPVEAVRPWDLKARHPGPLAAFGEDLRASLPDSDQFPAALHRPGVGVPRAADLGESA